MKNELSVALVCQEMLFRDLLRQIMQDRGYTVTGDYSTLKNLGETLGEVPDLLVFEVDSHNPASVEEQIRQMRAIVPGTRTAVLVQADDLDSQIASVRAEADGVIRKDVTVQSFIDNLALMASGEFAYPAFLLRQILSDPSSVGADTIKTARPDPLEQFSQQEKRVIYLLIEGATNKEIGRQLGIAESTVKGHVRQICRRTRCDNRTQAAMWARRHLDTEGRGGQFRSAGGRTRATQPGDKVAG